jgi:hypothetical protein
MDMLFNMDHSSTIKHLLIMVTKDETKHFFNDTMELDMIREMMHERNNLQTISPPKQETFPTMRPKKIHRPVLLLILESDPEWCDMHKKGNSSSI